MDYVKAVTFSHYQIINKIWQSLKGCVKRLTNVFSSSLTSTLLESIDVILILSFFKKYGYLHFLTPLSLSLFLNFNFRSLLHLSLLSISGFFLALFLSLLQFLVISFY